MRLLLRSKIHKARITETDVEYVGSITIDTDLMKRADIWPGEKVLVADIENGARFETYVLEGEAGSGTIGVNGAAARLVRKDDHVIIMAFEVADMPIRPKILLVNEHNEFTRYL